MMSHEAKKKKLLSLLDSGMEAPIIVFVNMKKGEFRFVDDVCLVLSVFEFKVQQLIFAHLINIINTPID